MMSPLPLVSLVRRSLPGVPTVAWSAFVSRLNVADNYSAIRTAGPDYEKSERYSNGIGSRLNRTAKKLVPA